MENWQKDRIFKNIFELVKSTSCSKEILDILAREHLISGWDISQLSAQVDCKHDTEMSLKLYMIFYSTLPSTYSIFCKALELTGQTRPLEILKERPTSILNNNVESLENLEGGNEACTISAVVDELFDAPCAYLLLQKWTNLAMKLEIRRVKVETLRQQLLMNVITNQDVLFALLEEWRNRNKNLATLNALINALRSMQLGNMADRLQRKFEPTAVTED